MAMNKILKCFPDLPISKNNTVNEMNDAKRTLREFLKVQSYSDHFSKALSNYQEQVNSMLSNDTEYSQYIVPYAKMVNSLLAYISTSDKYSDESEELIEEVYDYFGVRIALGCVLDKYSIGERKSYLSLD